MNDDERDDDMEIKGIGNTEHVNYPKKTEISKKTIKEAILSKWGKIGITYAIIESFMQKTVYGTNTSELTNSLIMDFAGGVEAPYFALEVFGKEIEISQVLSDQIEIILYSSENVWKASLLTAVLFIIFEFCFGSKLKNKKRLLFLGIIILTGVIAFLLYLAYFKFNIISVIGSW